MYFSVYLSVHNYLKTIFVITFMDLQFTCKRCGYNTDVKHTLLRHWARKNTCPPTNQDVSISDLKEELANSDIQVTYSCKFCAKTFKNKGNMYKHAQICKKKPQDAINVLTIEIEKLKEKIEHMEKKSLTSSNNTINNQQNAHIINNFNIKIRNFGFETLTHLDQEFLNRCFARKMIVELLDQLHLDKKCPENHNVRIKSKKQELMEIYEDGSWKLKDQDETLTELIQNGYRILRKHGKHNKEEIMDEEEIDEDEYLGIVRWLEMIYEDQKLQKPLKRDMIIRFLNNQAYLLGK